MNAQEIVIPPAAREFRGLWVASVNNIDWPSKPGRSVAEQKQELVKILNLAADLKMNAIVLQVRPSADALYKSDLEPWSHYLTGQQGKAPEPAYDPLEFAIRQAHSRGMELHAWFNPYRAGVNTTNTASLAKNHIAVRSPELVYRYGSFLWMDPGREEVQDHTTEVILDVVRRYDIDAVHFDDYFYPYVAKDSAGKLIPFPDDATYAQYKAEGGTLSQERWREENVNTLIRRLGKEIKQIKPQVKFGISPFGIWKPGFPSGTVGLDSVKELHADSRLWWRQGWLDYLVPQLYWKIKTPGHAYEQLLKWWAAENVHQRHLYAGNGAHRLSGKDAWTANEIVNQVVYTRAQPGAVGNVFFNARVFLNNAGGINAALKQGPYLAHALPPAAPWLDNERPQVPKVQTSPGTSPESVQVKLEPAGAEKPFLWAVYAYSNDAWRMEVLPGGKRELEVKGSQGKPPALVAISAVDRVGNESDRALVRLDPNFVPPVPATATPGVSQSQPATDTSPAASPIPSPSPAPTASPAAARSEDPKPKGNLPVLFSSSTSTGPRHPTTPTPNPVTPAVTPISQP